MTNDTTPSARWDAMTDQEKVEWLATEVMGWKIEPQPEGWGWWPIVTDADGYVFTAWKPLTNWNHWHQVEEKVIAKGAGFLESFVFEVGDLHCPEGTQPEWNAHCVLRADLPTRAKALYLAFHAQA